MFVVFRLVARRRLYLTSHGAWRANIREAIRLSRQEARQEAQEVGGGVMVVSRGGAN